MNAMFLSMQFMVFTALAISGCLLLGGALIFGGHDHGDIHGEHDAGHADNGHDHAPSLFSPRVFFSFLVGFGVAGAISSAYGANTAWATGIGFIPGVIMSLIAWGVGYFLFKQQVDSSIKPKQVISCIGVVSCAIRPANVGEVDVSVNGQIVSYNARSETGKETIETGTRVRVVNEFGGQVTVRKETVNR